MNCKPLLFPLSLCVAVAALSTAPAAQAGVHDDSWWSAGGTTINVDVAYVEGTLTLQTSTQAGFTNATTGTAASGSTVENPAAASSGVMTAPDGAQYKAQNGVMCRKVNGKWKPMRRTFRNPPWAEWGGGHTNGPGEEVVTLPFAANGVLSFEEYRNLYDIEKGRSAFRYEPN